MANEKLKARGKTFANGRFDDADLEISLPGRPTSGIASGGIPISNDAFRQLMIGQNENKTITFSREALLTILSQYGCAGVKFYLCNSPTVPGNRSLIAVGVDDQNANLRGIDATTQTTLMLEFGWPPDGF